MIGRIVSLAIVILIIAGAAWALWPRPVVVETAVAERRELVVSIEQEGLARVRELFRVSAPIAGRMIRVTMHAGDPVSLGQTIATIEPAGPGLLDDRSRRIAEASVEAANAGVSLAEAGLAQAEAQNAYAQSDMKRKSALAGRGLVSTQIEEQATLAAATAQKNVEVARATLSMREQDLERARAALIEGTGTVATGGSCCATVRSPVAGQVLAVLTESEQVVQPGTPLLELGEPTNLEIAVDVLSTDAVRINPRDSATIEAWGGEPLRAEVASISPAAFTKVSALGIEEQRTEVVLNLRDPPQKWSRLGHGFRVIARIVVWRDPAALSVPIGALFRQGGDWALYLVQDGRARLRRVTIGQRNGAFAQVVAGLEGGEVLIIHSPDTVQDGTPVALLQDAVEAPPPVTSADN